MPDNVRLDRLNRRIVACRRCPRLREHCAAVARQKRASFGDWQYWGRPVPNFSEGDADRVALLIVGLAPAAHGANRTGRMFTGDRSGDFLYRAMHAAGFASQAASARRGDGLALRGAAITAVAHCAPPANKPTPQEITNCADWLDQTFDLFANRRAVLCLGRIAFDAVLKLYQRRGWITRKSNYPFSHGAEHRVAGRPTVLCSYHPSQQNTFTGKLTEKMMLEVFERARVLIEEG